MPDNIQRSTNFIEGVAAQSPKVMARLMANGFDPSCLRTNDLLRKDEWVSFDTVLVEEAAIRLRGVADLLAAGFVHPLANAIGTTILEWEDVEDMQPAVRDMDAVTPGQRDRVEFNRRAIPIYVTHKDFRLSIRHLAASQRLGETIDTTQARTAARLVTESLEDALFNGAGVTVQHNSAARSVPGYTTHTDRNTGTLTGDWSTAGVTGENILTDTLSMVSALEGDRMYGPYWLYVPTNYSVKLNEDFKANSDKTIRQRLIEIDQITNIQVVDQLANDNVVLVQATPDVVDWVMGEEIQTIEWDEGGGFLTNFKVMAIQCPRIKSDAQGRSGVAHFTT